MGAKEEQIQRRMNRAIVLQVVPIWVCIIPAIVLWALHQFTTVAPVGSEWILRLLITGIGLTAALIAYGGYQFKKFILLPPSERASEEQGPQSDD